MIQPDSVTGVKFVTIDRELAPTGDREILFRVVLASDGKTHDFLYLPDKKTTICVIDNYTIDQNQYQTILI